MNDVLKIFLSLSLSGALLILTLLVCDHFAKDTLSRQWHYYIWLIVICAFINTFCTRNESNRKRLSKYQPLYVSGKFK